MEAEEVLQEVAVLEDAEESYKQSVLLVVHMVVEVEYIDQRGANHEKFGRHLR